MGRLLALVLSFFFLTHGWVGSPGTGLAQQTVSTARDVEIIAQLGHGTQITALAVSSDGRLALSGDRNGAIKLWGINSRKLIRTLPNHSGAVTGLAFLPDSRRIVTASYGDGWRLMDALDSRTLLKRKVKQARSESGPNHLSLLPDGRRLVLAAREGLELFDLETRVRLHNFNAFDGLLAHMTTSPDGQTTFTVGYDGVIRRWNTDSGEQVESFPNPGGAIPPNSLPQTIRLAVSPDGKTLASVTEHAQSVHLIELQTKRAEKLPLDSANLRFVSEVQFSPDQRALVVGSEVSGMVWDLEQKAALQYPAIGLIGLIRFIPFSDGKDDQRIPAISRLFPKVYNVDIKTFRWFPPALGKIEQETPTTRIIRTALEMFGGPIAVASAGEFLYAALPARYDPVSGWRWTDRKFDVVAKRLDKLSIGQESAGGAHAMAATSGFARRDISRWNIRTGQCTAVEGALQAASGQILALGGGRALVRDGVFDDMRFSVFDSSTGARSGGPYSPSSAPHERQSLSSLAPHLVTPDGRRAILTYLRGDPARPSAHVDVWNLDTGTRIGTFMGHQKINRTAALMPDGQHVLSADNDDNLYIWSIETQATVRHGQLPRVNDQFRRSFTSVAIDPGGRTAYLAGSLYISAVDLTTMTLIHDFKIDVFQSGNSLALLPGGKQLAIAGNRSRIHICNTESGEIERVLTGHHDAVNGLAVTPDGKRLLSISADATLKHWDIATGELLATSISNAAGEWLTITPEGFFDSSEKGAGMLNAVRGFDVTTMASLAYELRRPALVVEKLKGDPEGKVKKAATELDIRKVMESGPAPEIRFLNAKDGQAFESISAADRYEREIPDTDGRTSGTRKYVSGVRLKVGITARDKGGVGRVEWYVGANGTRQFTDLINSEESGTTAVSTSEVDIIDSETPVRIVAFNKANLVHSEQTITIKASFATVDELAKLYVIAVGVSDYKLAPKLNLTGPKWDVLALKQALEKAEGKAYDKVVVRHLVDGDVTAEKIGQAFSEIGKDVLARDTFIFYVSAHGKRNADKEYFFLPADFEQRSNESYLDAVSRGGIGVKHLTAWFENIKARKRIEIYDTCEGGPQYKGGIDDERTEFILANRRMRHATGNVRILASSPEDVAIANYNGHSLMTYALLEAFVKGDKDGDRRLSLTELREYLDSEVEKISKKAFGKSQKASIEGTLANEKLILIGSRLETIPDLSADRSRDPGTMKPTHIVMAVAEVEPDARQPPAAQAKVGRLAQFDFVAVIGDPRGDGKVLVGLPGKGVVGWVDPGTLKTLPKAPG